MERVTRTAAELGDIACAILRGAGVPAADAEQTADVLLDAERSGVESHGLMRLASYVDRLAGGLMEPHPELQLSVQGAVGQMDGGNGLGLYIVKTILDKQGLQYCFTSMKSKTGMEFVIYF